MATRGPVGGQTAPSAVPVDEPQDVPAFCADPRCRKEYRRVVGPGRPQRYCSELCRRRAEKEERQLRARLQHFESVVAQARIDLAAYGRADDEEGVVDHLDVRRIAKEAVLRASGGMRFVEGSAEPAAALLRDLFEAVEPLVQTL